MEKAVISLIDSKTESPASTRQRLVTDELNAQARLTEAQARKEDILAQRESQRAMTAAMEAASDSPGTKKLKLELKLLEVKARLQAGEIRKMEINEQRAQGSATEGLRSASGQGLRFLSFCFLATSAHGVFVSVSAPVVVVGGPCF